MYTEENLRLFLTIWRTHFKIKPKEEIMVKTSKEKTSEMASNIAVLMVVSLCMMLFSSATTSENEDLVAATEEMQKANYFTFVMLINMSPPDTRLEGNVTFLMPKDRMLVKTAMPDGAISDFLLQHSIPSALLFETLEKFPTGTTIPSSLPNYMLRITNNGRKDFALNNVKIISPNICVAGSCIRCHGIDGILSEPDIPVRNSSTPPPPSCPNSTDSSCMASPPPSKSPPPPTTFTDQSPPTFTAPIPTEADLVTQRSGSFDGSLNLVTTLMLTLAGIYF